MQPDTKPTRNPWLKSMALGVVLAAAILGIAGLILERAFSPDPDSETFTVFGQPHTPTWFPLENNLPTANLRVLTAKFHSGNAPALDNQHTHKQHLFAWSYNNHFGQQAFAVTCDVQVQASRNWQDYLIQTHVTGGGHAKGAAEVQFEFDPETKTLKAYVLQHFHFQDFARITPLVFQWDGEQFALVME